MIEKLVEVVLEEGQPKKTVQVGVLLSEAKRAELVAFLRGNMDVFAWSHKDMPGIALEHAMHCLKIDPAFPPVCQKQRRFAPERNKAINNEVDRFLEIRAIEEYFYPVLLCNPVVVPKKNGKLKICMDFAHLNKACPKDSYHLPQIYQIVDATTGYNRMSFLDAYSGYNQIPMNLEDRIHTTFITQNGMFCYRVMPFGLKNAGVTYQRLMNKMFTKQLGRIIEVYIDDMVIKSKEADQHLRDIDECFQVLWHYKMRLNPTKCAFGVSSRQFLGHIVTKRGIEANPTQLELGIHLWFGHAEVCEICVEVKWKNNCSEQIYLKDVRQM